MSKNYYLYVFIVFIIIYSVHSHEDEKNITVAEHNGLIIINQHNISDNTVIMSSPLSKCMEKKNCTSCIEKDISLQCYWCDHRCFPIMDSQKGCESMNLNSERLCASDFSAISSTTVVSPSEKTFVKSQSNYYTRTHTIFFMLSLSCIIMILVWTLYACFIPDSVSGQVLIRLGQLH